MAWNTTLTRDEQINLVERCLSTATFVAVITMVIYLPRFSVLAWTAREHPFLSSFRADALAGVVAIFTLVVVALIGVIIAWWHKWLVNPRRIAIKLSAEQYRKSLAPVPMSSDARTAGTKGASWWLARLFKGGTATKTALDTSQKLKSGGHEGAPFLFVILLLIPGGIFFALSRWLGLDSADGMQDLLAVVAIIGVTAYLARCALIEVGTRLLATGQAQVPPGTDVR